MAVVVVLALVSCGLALSQVARSGTSRAAQQPPRRQELRQEGSAAARSATLAYAALRRWFGFVEFRHGASGSRHLRPHLWPFSQALSGSLMFGSLRGAYRAEARADALRGMRTLAGYRFGSGYRSVPLPVRDLGGNLYYDDNNWVALDLIDVYRLSGRQALLRRAEGVFRFLVSGWDTNSADACSGGIFWARPPLRPIRTTVSTANAALVALRLYQVTGRRNYLVWAQRLYGWVSRCLAGSDGLYYDDLDSLGNIATQEWTYNQGAMIAAGALLAHVTGRQTYLEQAQATTKAALAHYAASGYKGEPPIFVAIFFQDLNLARKVARIPSYRAALRGYLRRHVTLRPNGHFGSSLLFQAAAVQLYSLAAAPGSVLSPA